MENFVHQFLHMQNKSVEKEELKDTKGAIRICILKKKTKDRVTRTPLKTGGESKNSCKSINTCIVQKDMCAYANILEKNIT